jgi:RNA polymerase sigma-70 factor (ECF subfamily)
MLVRIAVGGTRRGGRPASTGMDDSQFEGAVRKHQRMVFSVALRSLRDRGLAEELTQEVFLSLYRHGEGFDSPEHLAAWLRRVAARKCIDQIRRRRWRRWLPLSDADGAAAPGHAEGRGDAWLSRRLQKLLQALPAAGRVALVLRYQEELEPAEIGRLLGISEDRARRELRRALAFLRKRIGPERAAASSGRVEAKVDSR